jgi:hypothetical protein
MTFIGYNSAMEEIEIIAIDPKLLQDAFAMITGSDTIKTDQWIRESLFDKIDIRKTLLEAVIQELEDAEPSCDHAVGICMCSVIGILDELKLAVQGKRTCPECHGDTFVYDEKETLYKATVGLNRDHDSYYDGEEYKTCPTCKGSGNVSIK